MSISPTEFVVPELCEQLLRLEHLQAENTAMRLELQALRVALATGVLPAQPLNPPVRDEAGMFY